MFKLIFGLIWTFFVTFIIIVCLVVPGEQGKAMDMSLPLFIYLTLFELIGLFMLSGGLKKIIKDKRTKTNGMHCYGIIRDIQVTGSYINNDPEYKAIIDFVNPETDKVENTEEIIGFKYNEYPINSYILCKYYQGDINLESTISESMVPEEIKKALAPAKKITDYSSIEFSSDGEYVTIDGVQYKKNQ